MPTNRPSTAGFTLLELLVSMTILLLVVTGVFSSLSVGLDLRSKCREQVDQLQSDRQLAKVLREDLSNLDMRGPCLAFEGEGLSLLRRRSSEENAKVVAVRYRWTRNEHVVREEFEVEPQVDFDRSEWLGYVITRGALTPAWLDSGEPEPGDPGSWHFAAFSAFRPVVLRWEDEGTTEGAPGIQSDPAAVRLAWAGETTDGFSGRDPLEEGDRDLTFWIPGPVVARAAP